MENKNKGFTLIELLVVVAIIGILAAVGTVAYTGYTSGAKKSSSKSNHASVVKYIAAEDQKCNVGTDKVFGVAVDNDNDAVVGTSFNCDKRDGDSVVAAAENALGDFKNPYSPASNAVRTAGVAHAAKGDMGFVNVEASDDTITVTTCFQNDCASSSDDVVNTVEVGE
tara:strand:+ start:178 stop:681 length:504 start_codon:yes stop_codon:yes gene_type:complete